MGLLRRAVGLSVAGALSSASCASRPGGQAPARNASSSSAGTDVERVALAFVDDLSRARWESAFSRVDARLAAAAGGPKGLEAAWRSVVAGRGQCLGFGAIEIERRSDRVVVHLDAQFAKESVRLRVTVDPPSGRVAGFFRDPAPPAETPAWTAPAYADPSSFEERRIDIPGDPSLPGTVSVPKARPGQQALHRAVVLLHGSGPGDRDETIGATRVFRDLAWGLASRDIIVLRYDKRTRVDGGAAVATERDEVVTPALHALATLRAVPGVDPARVFLVGHSQGAALAPRIAGLDGHLAGIVMLAPPARPLAEVVLAQVRYLARMHPSDDRFHRLVAQAEHLEARAEASDLSPTEEILVPGGGSVSGAYLHDASTHLGLHDATQLACPALIVQGGRDYQVTVADDLPLWRAALADKPRTEIRTYPALDHRLVAGEGPSVPEQYAIPGHVDAHVVSALTEWILSQ